MPLEIFCRYRVAAAAIDLDTPVRCRRRGLQKPSM
jgi:hypothetical protein